MDFQSKGQLQCTAVLKCGFHLCVSHAHDTHLCHAIPLTEYTSHEKTPAQLRLNPALLSLLPVTGLLT